MKTGWRGFLRQASESRLGEVFMFREMMKGYTIVEYRWVFLAKAAAFGLALVTGLAVVYIVTGSDISASADKTVQQVATKQVKVVQSASELRSEAIRSAVLNWMRKNSDMPDSTLSSIYDAAVKSGNADLILAVCAVESGFNPTARSDKGAMGLMGIMPKVWLNKLKSRGIVKGRRDLYGVAKNIASGAYVLGAYVDRTGNVEKALSGYAGGDPLYARKVLHELGEIYLVRQSALGGQST